MPHFASDFMFTPALRAHRVFALRAYRDPYTPFEITPEYLIKAGKDMDRIFRGVCVCVCVCVCF